MKRLSMTAALFMAALIGTPSAQAQKPADGKGKPGVDKVGTRKVPDGHVLTFYGLRKLEHDEQVSDEDKLHEWEAYIQRARANMAYAKKAVVRWKSAAKMRVIDAVQRDDRDPTMRPREKMKRWERVVVLYPTSKEARLAKRRMGFWRNLETKLLVEAAEDVERERRTKVERIRAWEGVTAWVSQGPEARAAQRRVAALQQQLFSEAQSLDRIGRVDAATKLASWRDVLAGAPTKQHRRLASKRVRELSAQTKAD